MTLRKSSSCHCDADKCHRRTFVRLRLVLNPLLSRLQIVSPRIKQKPTTRVGFCLMADEEGFEPPIRVTPYSRFRVARIQPLCHSSIKFYQLGIIIISKLMNAHDKNLFKIFRADWLRYFIPSPIFAFLNPRKLRFQPLRHSSIKFYQLSFIIISKLMNAHDKNLFKIFRADWLRYFIPSPIFAFLNPRKLRFQPLCHSSISITCTLLNFLF